MTLKDLRRALFAVAKEKEDTKTQKLFGAEDVVHGGQNVSVLGTYRVSRYARRNGVNWRLLDWDSLVEWIKNNWDGILRVLLSILAIIIL